MFLVRSVWEVCRHSFQTRWSSPPASTYSYMLGCTSGPIPDHAADFSYSYVWRSSAMPYKPDSIISSFSFLRPHIWSSEGFVRYLSSNLGLVFFALLLPAACFSFWSRSAAGHFFSGIILSTWCFISAAAISHADPLLWMLNLYFWSFWASSGHCLSSLVYSESLEMTQFTSFSPDSMNRLIYLAFILHFQLFKSNLHWFCLQGNISALFSIHLFLQNSFGYNIILWAFCCFCIALSFPTGYCFQLSAKTAIWYYTRCTSSFP